jgi:hypothetical protein
MQPACQIGEGSIDVGSHCLINGNQIGHNRPDTAGSDAFVCPSAHPATQEHLTVGNRFGHTQVAIVGLRPKTVRLTGFPVVRFSAKLRMAQFFPQLALGDLAVFDREDKVVRGSAEVLADYLTVIRNHSDLHSILLYIKP